LPNHLDTVFNSLACRIKRPIAMLININELEYRAPLNAHPQGHTNNLPPSSEKIIMHFCLSLIINQECETGNFIEVA
jgi:hypothetical protein